jgi:DNA polymerase III alpha subunit (gram-positive type)
MRVLVYDTETGGLDAEKHSLFSLGALVGDLDSGEIIDMFEAFHRLPSVEDYVYTQRAIEVHGITPEEAFNNGISTDELQAKFSDLWFNNGAAIIGGHNEPFDRRFVARQLFNISVPEFESNFTYRSLDSLPVMRLYTGHDKVKAGASLEQATKALKIDMSDHGKNKYHAALFDSIACFRVLHRFRNVFRNPEFAEALIS